MKAHFSILTLATLFVGQVYAGDDHSGHTDYTGSYEINNQDTGTVVKVVVDTNNNTRNIMSNAMPNIPTGQFPGPANPNTISAQELNYTFTTAPVNTGSPTKRHTVGVAVNGIIFEPQTNEWFECETGEEYRIEAIQDRFDLGLDLNNAHVQPNGEYHFHGIPDKLAEMSDSDLVLMGFAADGFLIYSSKSDAYQSGYTLKTSLREGTNCAYRKRGPNGGSFAMDQERNGVITDDWEFTGGEGTLAWIIHRGKVAEKMIVVKDNLQTITYAQKPSPHDRKYYNTACFV